MPLLTRELLRRLPKAELHCHLDGSLRPETMLDLGREFDKPMPAPDAESLREYMTVDDARNLEDYLERFAVTLSVMQTEPALERIAYELAGGRGARRRALHRGALRAGAQRARRPLAGAGGRGAAARSRARAEAEHGINGRVIVTAIRNMAPSVSQELAELAVAYRHRGVVGFDLAGGEAGNPAKAHRNAFAYARSHDLACTCHAGEGDGADSVREAVHVCGAHRIGHATRLIEDTSLTDYCNDRRIALEVCLTSNVQTRVADSYATHPFREYFDRGLNVTLNTDNRLMSGATLTDEYVHAAESLDFGFDELARVALNGFESCFLPYEERMQLVAEVQREITALRSVAA